MWSMNNTSQYELQRAWKTDKSTIWYYDALLLDNLTVYVACRKESFGYTWKKLQDNIMQFSTLEKQKATSILISHPALLHFSQAALVILSRLCMAHAVGFSLLSPPFCPASLHRLLPQAPDWISCSMRILLSS